MTPHPAPLTATTPAPRSPQKQAKEPQIVLVRMGVLTTVHLPGPTQGLAGWLDSNANHHSTGERK